MASLEPTTHVAFAVYSADDNSLNFYKRDTVPTAGSSFNGKTATAVYTGIETDVYNWNTLPWYSNHSSITSVSIVDSGIAPVSTAYWFYRMNNASLTTISGLDKLDTSKATNMSGMFYNCSALTTLDLSSFDTSKATNMSGMFYDCPKLTSLDVSGWNTANVTNMGNMFSGCSALTTLDLSSFDTSNVTNMGYMFSGCKALTTIYAGDGWSTTKVTSSGSMFSNCSKLPNFSSYTDKTNAHYNSGGYLIKFDKVYYAWNGLGTNAADYTCKAYRFVNNNGTIDKQSINSTTIIRNSYTADSVTLTATFNDDWAIAQTKTFTNSGFAVYSADNNSLNFYKRIGALTAGSTLDDRIATAVYTGIETDKYSSNRTVPWADYTSSITSVSIVDSGIAPVSTAYWFYQMNNASLTTISGLDKLDTTNVTDMCGMFYNCSALTSLDVRHFNTSKVTDMNSMFQDCQALTSLDVSSFNTVNVTNMYSMFSGCWTLTTLDLSGFDTGNVTSMGYMFSHCIALTTLDLSSFDTSKVTDMSGMFYDCPKLTSLDVSGWNTANVTSMYSMFSGCSALTTLDLSSFDTSNVTSMARMFMNCAKLTSITGLNNWNTSKVTTMESMFQGTALTTLDLSSFDTSNVTSMARMFMNCAKLTSITGLNNWNTSKVTTMQEMFYGCSVLTSLDVSEWNTANVKNMYNMFRICSSLTTLDLSSFDTSNVTNMGYMFKDCSSLSTIYVGDKWSTAKATSSSNMFYGCSKLPNFNSSYIDKTRAHYNSGGYLTYKQYIPKIVFVANSGLFQSDSSTTKSVQTNLDGTTSLSALVEFPTKSGYVFRGWSISSTGVVTYTPYATPTISNATWLYAVWQKAESYLIREDSLVNIANAIRTKSNTSATMTPDEMATAISGLSTKAILTLSTSHSTAPSNISAKYTKPTNPTATGYTFVNWYKDSALTTLFDFDAVAEGGTAYAKWSINAPTISNPDISGDGTTSYTLGTVTPAGSGQTVYYSADNVTWSTTCPKQSAIGTYTTYWKITAQDCDDLTGSFTTTVSDTRTAFAVYSATDNSLNFYKRSAIPTAGSTFNGKTATAVYTGIETDTYAAVADVPWYNYVASITNVTVVDTVKPVSTRRWFNKFTNMQNCNVSKLDTSAVTTMFTMFQNCTSLTSLDVSSFNTANVTDMGGMFACNTSSTLTSITGLSSFDTANVTNMQQMFSNCASLTSLDVSSFNTANVTNMSYMFSYCKALTSLDVSNFNTANVTNMRSMFLDCLGLTSLDVSNFNTANVTNMRYMFASDDAHENMKLTSITGLSGFDTSKVTDMISMFQNCSSLTSLDVSSFNTSKVKDMSNMFFNGWELISIYVGDKWSTASVTSSSNMFKNCSKLPNFNSSYTDKACAHYDLGGYLTYKAAS